MTELTTELLQERMELIEKYISASWHILGIKREKVFTGWRGVNRIALRICMSHRAISIVPISWDLEQEQFGLGSGEVSARKWSVLSSGSKWNLLDIPRVYVALFYRPQQAMELIEETLQDLVRVAREEFHGCAEHFAPQDNAEMWRTLDRMFILAEEREIMLAALSGIRADCLASWKIVGKNKFIAKMRGRVEEAFDRMHTIKTVRRLEIERI